MHVVLAHIWWFQLETQLPTLELLQDNTLVVKCISADAQHPGPIATRLSRRCLIAKRAMVLPRGWETSKACSASTGTTAIVFTSATPNILRAPRAHTPPLALRQGAQHMISSMRVRAQRCSASRTLVCVTAQAREEHLTGLFPSPLGEAKAAVAGPWPPAVCPLASAWFPMRGMCVMRTCICVGPEAPCLHCAQG